jgi:hypothetical protein
MNSLSHHIGLRWMVRVRKGTVWFGRVRLGWVGSGEVW